MPLTDHDGDLQTGETFPHPKGITPGRLILWTIIAIGCFLRIWHLTWGLPELYEEAYPLRISSQMWNWGKPGLDFNPHFFNYPAFTFYLQFIIQAIRYGIGHLLGIYPDLQTFGNALQASIVSGRLVSVLFDTGTIMMVYLVGKRMAGIETGLIAAALIAINPLHIAESHLINVDIPLTFFSVLALYFIFLIEGRGERRWYYLAGASIGCAAASKYTGAFLLSVLVAVHILGAARRRSNPDPERRRGSASVLIGAIILSGILFLAWNPFILLSFGEFYRGLSFEQFHMSYGHLGIDPSENGYLHYLLRVLPDCFGWPMMLVIAVSALFLFVSRDRRGYLVLAFPIILVGVIGSWAMRADRYILPAIPMLALAGATGIVMLRGRLMSLIGPERFRTMRKMLPVVILAVAAAIAYPSASAVMAYHESFALPDTRTVAKDWISSRLPPGSVYATGPFGIEFPAGRYSAVEIPFSPMGSENLWPFYDTRWYEDLDLLVAADYDYGRFIREPERFRRVLAYYDSLHADWIMEIEIRPAEHQQGPTLWMYRYPPDRKKEFFDASLLDGLRLVTDTSLVVEFAERLGFALFTKGNLAKSEQIMGIAVVLEPDNTRLLRESAWTCFKAGNYDAALDLLDRSLRLNPAQPEVVGLRGSVLLRMGRGEEAETDLLRAVEANPKLEFPYLDLESLYRLNKAESKLIGILGRHMAILPAGSEGWKKLDEEMRSLGGKKVQSEK